MYGQPQYGYSGSAGNLAEWPIRVGASLIDGIIIAIPYAIGGILSRDQRHAARRLYLIALGFIGYLWPLWDEKKQTFADKINNTYAIKL